MLIPQSNFTFQHLNVGPHDGTRCMTHVSCKTYVIVYPLPPPPPFFHATCLIIWIKPFCKIKAPRCFMQHVSQCKPSFKEDTIHSSHLPQLFPFMMHTYVYVIGLTVGCVSEHGFNVPLTLRSYGDGDISLQSHPRISMKRGIERANSRLVG